MLDLVVTKINEGEDTLSFTKIIDMYDLENAVLKYGQKMKIFKGFTGQIYIKSFKHIGSKIILGTSSNQLIVWKNDIIDVTLYDCENAHICISYLILNEEDEEQEVEIIIDTNFDY